MSRGRRLYALLLALLLLAAGLSAWLQPAPLSSLPSAHNPGPQGLMALRLLLEQVPDLAVEVLYHERGEPDRAPAVRLLAEPAARPFTDDEVARLLRQVERGQRLVLLMSGREGRAALGLDGFLAGLGLDDVDVLPCVPALQGAHGLLTGVAPLHAEVAHLLQPAPAWASLASCARGSAVLFAPRGQGQILLLSELELVDNQHLGQPGHASLALNLMAPPGASRLVFDETHHRSPPPASLLGLLRLPPFGATALGLVLAGLLLVWARAPRLGGVRPTPRLTGAPVQRTIQALALHYAHSEDLGSLWQRCLELARSHRVPVPRAAAPSTQRELQQRLRQILAAVDEARHGRPGPGPGLHSDGRATPFEP